MKKHSDGFMQPCCSSVLCYLTVQVFNPSDKYSCFTAPARHVMAAPSACRSTTMSVRVAAPLVLVGRIKDHLSSVYN